MLLTACNGGDDQTQVTTANNTENVTTTAETEDIKPELEEKDFGGRTFIIMTERWSTYEPLDCNDIVSDGYNGEVLNDATYQRNLNMSSKYNCEVEWLQQKSSQADNALSTSITAGDKICDVYLIRGTRLASSITKGYLTEFDNISSIDTDKPWWDQNSLEALTVHDKAYATIGYTSTNYLKSVFTVCFNKTLIKDNALENPYDLVDSGKWTFDKVAEMGESIAVDLNGDGVRGTEDMWGINYTRDTLSGIFQSCGVTYGTVNQDGEAVLTIDDETNVERMTNIVPKLFDSSYSADTLSGTYIKATAFDGEFFANSKVLFLFTATHPIEYLRAMTIDFGMLPYPKYSEDENYKPSVACIFISLTSVPVTSADELDDVGYFLEAYAYEGYTLLKPAFYEKILLGKVANDEDSMEMLQYIYENLNYDIATLYNFSSMTGTVNDLSKTLNVNVSSYLRTYIAIWQSSVDNFNRCVE